LQAHLARANPHWKSLDNQKVLIVFQGENAYISPQWYASKDEHGKVVPTWNYVMVQARGTVKVIDDVAWLKKQITALTNHQESQFESGWKVSDAPAAYIDAEIRGIIGIEIALSSIEGKWKVSQNRNQNDRAGVSRNLNELGNQKMSALVKEYGE
jgi:transcriptional regulator